QLQGSSGAGQRSEASREALADEAFLAPFEGARHARGGRNHRSVGAQQLPDDSLRRPVRHSYAAAWPGYAQQLSRRAIRPIREHRAEHRHCVVELRIVVRQSLSVTDVEGHDTPCRTGFDSSLGDQIGCYVDPAHPSARQSGWNGEVAGATGDVENRLAGTEPE